MPAFFPIVPLQSELNERSSRLAAEAGGSRGNWAAPSLGGKAGVCRGPLIWVAPHCLQRLRDLLGDEDKPALGSACSRENTVPSS